MSLRKLHLLLIAIVSTVVFTAFASCQDQGTRFSYNEVSSAAYGRQVEADYDALLNQYVDSTSSVRYSAWLKTPLDVSRLKSTLDAMSKADDSAMSADGRKAFYLNAYNAMTLDLILSHYAETLGQSGSPRPGVRSIRNIGGFDASVWDHFQWKIAGKSRSLNDIENRILRPMGDARIHFAIVCASVGCPPLHNHAFSADTLNATLDQLADSFVNAGRKTTFDRAGQVIHTSQILNWFGKDFVNSFGSVKAFFTKYAHVVPTDELANYAIQFDDYDWTLNVAKEEPIPVPSPSPTPPPGSFTEHSFSDQPQDDGHGN